MLRTLLICCLLLTGCNHADMAPSAPEQPAPVAPRPVAPAKTRLLFFTQPGCAPCRVLEGRLNDPALHDEMAKFIVEKVQPPDSRFREYDVRFTPVLIALSADGPKRCPHAGMTLGQLALWLSEVEPKADATVGKIVEGGPIGPNGEIVTTDIPCELRAKNVGGKDGSGLCVFTSIMHSARFQNEKGLFNLQSDMRAEMGGGWPQKVTQMLKKYGGPGIEDRFFQYEGTDLSVLEKALATGRCPGVTYNGRDCHYGGTIAHMVNLIYLDSKGTKSAAILDNNFVGENQIVWMSSDEFAARWTGGRNGWAVILCAPRPPAVPKNDG